MKKISQKHRQIKLAFGLLKSEMQNVNQLNLTAEW
jgi:hypothetical protein